MKGRTRHIWRKADIWHKWKYKREGREMRLGKENRSKCMGLGLESGAGLYPSDKKRVIGVSISFSNSLFTSHPATLLNSLMKCKNVSIDSSGYLVTHCRITVLFLTFKPVALARTH
jgi:hypothetical protein